MGRLNLLFSGEKLRLISPQTSFLLSTRVDWSWDLFIVVLTTQFRIFRPWVYLVPLCQSIDFPSQLVYSEEAEKKFVKPLRAGTTQSVCLSDLSNFKNTQNQSLLIESRNILHEGLTECFSHHSEAIAKCMLKSDLKSIL